MCVFRIIIIADVEETFAWNGSELADTYRHVFWDVADVVAVFGEYFDCVGVVWIGWFCFQCAGMLTEIAVYVITVGHASNLKFEIVTRLLILGPYADIVAGVFGAEVFQIFYNRTI